MVLLVICPMAEVGCVGCSTGRHAHVVNELCFIGNCRITHCAIFCRPADEDEVAEYIADKLGESG